MIKLRAKTWRCNECEEIRTKTTVSTLGGRLFGPEGVAVDGEGNVFVADSRGRTGHGHPHTHTHRVQQISRDGVVSTLAGCIGAHGACKDGAGADARTSPAE